MHNNSSNKNNSHTTTTAYCMRLQHCIILHRLVEEIRGMAEVKYVERNQVVKALQTQCEVQSGATWGLVRTTMRDWNTNPNDPPNEYSHDKKGTVHGVRVVGRVLRFTLPDKLDTTITSSLIEQRTELVFDFKMQRRQIE